MKKGKVELDIDFIGYGEGVELGKSQECISLVFTRKRFSAEPHEIYSVYPPKESKGDYRYHLPHIVFNRASFPWEFSEDSTPSIALFLLREGEGAICKEMKVRDVCGEEEGVFIVSGLTPKQDDADKLDDTCKVVDIPVEQFRALWVGKKQRKLLSHVREVSLNDKVTDPEIKDGKFSVVISHRFPEEELNYMFAVSLAEYDGVSIPENCKFVRCICYFRWEFYSVEKPYDFLGEMKKLKTGTLTRQISDRVKAQELRELLERGFLPMNHDMREGSKTVSWYRGPWIPYEEELEEPQYRIFSDELYYYDNHVGMLDVSYAAAWQLGRMVAMHHSSMAGELISWRLQDYYKAAVKKQKEEIKEALRSETEDVREALRGVLQNAVQRVPNYEEETDGP